MRKKAGTTSSRWIRRQAHQRRTKSGTSTSVRSHWELRAEGHKQTASSYRHPCPDCGAFIISVKMKRGGWAHFEGAEGLEREKHACFHRGEGLGRKRDNETPDLLEWAVRSK